jgi:hypothetical protein
VAEQRKLPSARGSVDGAPVFRRSQDTCGHQDNEGEFDIPELSILKPPSAPPLKDKKKDKRAAADRSYNFYSFYSF